MADFSDVLTALADAVSVALYPSGVSGPTAPSIAGPVVTVQPGWPVSGEAFEAFLAAGNVYCNTYGWKEDRNTTRYMEQWFVQEIFPPTITASVSGLTVTLGGVFGAGQNVGVLANGEAYVYRTVPGDTLTTTASNLAAAIVSGLAATNVSPVVPGIPGVTASGPTLTLPSGTLHLSARVGGGGVGVKEIRRQERIFQVGIWAGTPALRDAVAAVIDPALSNPRYLTMPDQFQARIIYHGSIVVDSEQKMGIYRRDLLFKIEYATTITEAETSILVTRTDVFPEASSPDAPALVTQPVIVFT